MEVGQSLICLSVPGLIPQTNWNNQYRNKEKPSGLLRDSLMIYGGIALLTK